MSEEKRAILPRPKMTFGVYKHYKGGFYEAYGLSMDEATGIWCVLYRNPQSGLCFHRPHSEWAEKFQYFASDVQSIAPGRA